MIETEEYVIRMENALIVFEAKKISPVLISVPHDGLPFHALSGFFEPRKRGYIGRDLHVWAIAKDILMSVAVSAIRGLMPRPLVDYNRAWLDSSGSRPLVQESCMAFDDARLRQPYERYHASIDRILQESIKKFGKEGILFVDLHGFTKQPPYAPERGYDLILGTGNRISVPHRNIDERFARHMSDLGYSVFLPEEKNRGHGNDYYSAGFITRHYSMQYGINAIQIEVARRFRGQEALELGQKLSQDLAGFIKDNYLT